MTEKKTLTEEIVDDVIDVLEEFLRIDGKYYDLEKESNINSLLVDFRTYVENNL